MASAKVNPASVSGGNSLRCSGVGFSLIELVIVCGLVAILLSIAMPNYRSYVQRAYRSSAIELLIGAVTCQQRIYLSELSYDTGRCLPNEHEQRYRLRYVPAETTELSGYTVIAEPVGDQRTDGCGSLSLNHSGVRGISGPATQLRPCWEGR
jgi:type IV pilus assembly protein PilE